MGIHDPLLPAALHLTGEHADDVLGPAVEHVGGRLLSHRCSQVHYRPGHDLTARFRCRIDWGDGSPREETLYAGTCHDGAPTGTVPVVAEVGDDRLEAGVWRWPFDPHLPGLETVVRSTGSVLDDLGVVVSPRSTHVEVVTYRPLERAVLRIRSADRTWYAKLVHPDEVAAVARRHAVLGRHDVPVPRIEAEDRTLGLVVMSEVPGPTLRDLIKADARTWVPPATIVDLLRRLAAVEADGLTAMRSRLQDAPHHVALLSRVLPDERRRLEEVDERLREALRRAVDRGRTFVHGDLHERQLVVADGAITGLLDVDESGLGDPLDDVAVPVAHLRHRALTAPNGPRIDALADGLVVESSGHLAIEDVAAGSAAVLVGLATGPFRAQHEDWPQHVRQVLEVVDRTLDHA